MFDFRRYYFRSRLPHSQVFVFAKAYDLFVVVQGMVGFLKVINIKNMVLVQLKKSFLIYLEKIAKVGKHL